MKTLNLVLIGAALFFASTVNAAIYNVDRVIGQGEVHGYIETDGTLGTINFSNFIDYHLEITGPNFSNGPLGIIDISSSPSYLVGSGMSATSDDLLFDTTGSGFILWWTSNQSHYWCLEVSGCSAGFASETLGYESSFGVNRIAQPGEFAFASVSPVPVPAAVWLFGTALIGLFGFGRRKVGVSA